VGILGLSFVFVASLPNADAATISCPQISNWELEDWSLTNYEYYDRFECHYFDHDSLSPRASLTSHITTNLDQAMGMATCSGTWVKNYYQGEFYSSSHRLNVYYEYADDDHYDLIISGAKSLMQQLESKNAAVSCTQQDTPTECPSDFPYLHSDNQCWDVPECTGDFPYLHSDNQCWDVPECTGDFPYLHSDNQCWDVPECTGDFPYLHSDNQCWDVPECTGDFPYLHSDNQCWDVQECDADFPYLHSDGQCWNVPEELTDDTVEEEPVEEKPVEEEPEQEVTEVVALWETMDGKKIWVDGQWKVADEKGFGVLSEKSNKVSGFAFDKNTSFALGFLGKENCGQLVMRAVESQEFLGSDPWELCYKKKLWWEKITAPPDPQCGQGNCSESKQWEFYGKTARFLYDGIAAARSSATFDPLKSPEYFDDFMKDLRQRDPKNNPIASFFDSLTDQVPLIAFLKSGGVYLVHDLPNYMMSDLYAEKIGAGSVSITGGTNFFPANPTPEIIAVDGGPYLFVKGTELSVRVENGVTTLMVFDGSVLALNPVSPYNVEIIEANEYLIASSQKFEKGAIEPSSVDRWWDAVLIPDDKEPERETMVSEMQEKSDNGGGCLIATATFGSELAPQVQQLRELRDNTLLQTESGSTFMSAFNQFYYSFSPTIADLERQNPMFKEAVKLAITPLIASLSILNYVDIDSEAEMLGYGISLILLNVGMYFVAPAMVIIHLKKRF